VDWDVFDEIAPEDLSGVAAEELILGEDTGSGHVKAPVGEFRKRPKQRF
jgi:hypothetical protein